MKITQYLLDLVDKLAIKFTVWNWCRKKRIERNKHVSKND